ncbi:MAG TPA: VOC family protein [Longimicrobiales bacterium]|nr:VOC family protein [Longimicrobiales bacterium]
MPHAGAQIRKLGQVAVTVRDPERARAFYRDVLGLVHLFDAPPALSFFDCGGVRLMLAVPDPGEFDHPTSLLYLDVESIETARDVLESRGVHFDRAPEPVAELGERTLWLAFFRDSEGNLLGLMSEVPRTQDA